MTMSKRLVAMCLGPKAGCAFDIREVPRRRPAPDEVEIAVEAASVNPIDVHRADGYGRRLLSLLGASRFPMVLGNDFAGTIATIGRDSAPTFAVGERVYGVKPASRDGSHTSYVIAKAAHVRRAPASRDLQELAALPYCFVTMWLAAAAAGVIPQNAAGKKVLVHGAAGGLGRLALQALPAWGARLTAIAKSSDRSACLAAGAVEVVDRHQLAQMRGAFDATLNFATWDDEPALLACLREGALGHATTVHPLVQNFDDKGWVGGALRTLRQKREMRARVPKEAHPYAWILFRPDTAALTEMARLVELGRLSLPIGIRAPLRQVDAAFHHVRSHLAGRALLIP